MWRSFMNQARLPQQSYIKVGATVFVAALCLVIYWDIDDDKAGVQNRQGALFFICINNGFSGVNNVNLIFPMERPVFLREVNNNMYTVSAYFWSKIFSELPMSIAMPTLQALIVYFGLGLNTDEWFKFPLFLLTSILGYNAFTCFGYILGTSISNKQVAVILTPVLIVPTMLFAGFFVNQDNIPWFLIPFREIAIFKYAF
jgi:ABC-type multidrug transport system permease subunit